MFCCGRSYQPCPRHTNKQLTSMCVDPGCYQPLCILCQGQHMNLHHSFESRKPPIKSIVQVEEDCLYAIDMEIKCREAQYKLSGNSKNTKDMIKDWIDEYFYKGSAERLRVLKLQKEALRSKPSMKLLLDVLTEDRFYEIDDDFQRRFEGFLMQNVIVNNLP